jgi:hypothetical protein
MANILNLTNYGAVRAAQGRLVTLVIETNGAFDVIPAIKRDSLLQFQNDIGKSISVLAQAQMESKTDSQFEFSMSQFDKKLTQIERLWEAYKSENLGGTL